MQYSQVYLVNLLGQSVVKDLRQAVFKHIMRLKLRYFNHTPLGSLITRTISDLETLSDVFSEGFVLILADLLQIVAIVAFMLYTDTYLAGVILLPIPLIIVVTYFFKKAIKRTFEQVRNAITQLNTFLQEHITGMPIVQLFAREAQEYEKFTTINARYKQANIRSNWYYAFFFPVVEFISAISVGLLIWYGAKSISQNTGLSPGILVSFMLYINLLYKPLRELADKFNTLQMGLVCARRIFLVLDNPDTEVHTGKLAPKALQGALAFQDVSFGYKDSRFVLKNISFVVKPGKVLALVGSTGAGKSTVIQLLNRFYEPSQGLITLDSKPLAAYNLSYLRQQISVVMQDVFLFSGSIFDNIALQNPSITRSLVLKACEQIGIMPLIESLPLGLDFKVMERGKSLSKGQAQLISFVRALVMQPAILVLDEATASIDTQSEALLQAATHRLMQGRTTIVIAHRLSTIAHADQIILLDAGRIQETGSHSQLMALGGAYKRLVDLQFQSRGLLIDR